jgi:hypothetical protein
MWGSSSNSGIYVGNSGWGYTGVPLSSNTFAALEVDAGAGTLHFFINGEQTPHRVTGVPNDVYFGVWYFICEFEIIYILIIIICTIIIIIIVMFIFFFLFQLCSRVTSRSYEILSLCALSSPSTANDFDAITLIIEAEVYEHTYRVSVPPIRLT